MDYASSDVEDELTALPKNEDMLNSLHRLILPGDRDNQVYTPPPHIAARFWRSSSNRRKSSAASSRRNSLTSSHSHHSNRSFRKGCQSNHVAQYLRRASILESRKARLADQAAHAEQVRLRAALVKAAPRSSNTGEKLLAAHNAREKYLAKVAASCADEVNRVKRVAEDIKEKKAAEERRCRLDMEEKHAEAERRRQEYRRVTRKVRNTSLHTVEGKKAPETSNAGVSVETAASRIQRAWRQYQRRSIITEFLGINLTVDRVHHMSFVDASTLLANGELICTTRRIMNHFQIQFESEDENTNVRRLLSAYMILGHPTDIFSKDGQQEQDLINKARDVLTAFQETLIDASRSKSCTAHPTQLETLSHAHASYVTAFAAWRALDASVLVATMVDQFVVLDAIWQIVKNDTRGEVANDYAEGIRNNQIILLSKIKKLAGPAKASSLIKKAIKESRTSKPAKITIADMRPRPLANPNAATPTLNPSVISSGSAEATAVGEANLASSCELDSAGLSRVFSIIPPNRVVAHELLIDPSWRIDAPLQSDVRNALNQEICEGMRRGIEQGSGEVWIVAIADSIRTRLLRLLNSDDPRRQLLSEVLDAAHVRNQCQLGLFSYEAFFSFMADLLPTLCAPVRDPWIRSVLVSSSQELGAMIEKLCALLQIVDVMSLDHTNYLIQQQAPLLIREAHGYERRSFAQDVESGTITLDRTRRWWRQAVRNLSPAELYNSLESVPPLGKVHACGLVHIALGLGHLEMSDVPETLQLDQDRLRRVRVDMLRFTIAGAVLLTAKSLLKRDVRTQWKPEARRISEAIEAKGYDNSDGQLGSRIAAIVESSHGLPPASREQLAHTIARFLAEAQTVSNPQPSSQLRVQTIQLSDPVLKLLHQRLKAHIYNCLAASTSSERVRVASTASERLAATGLTEFLPQITAVIEELRRVSDADQTSHGEWYQEISNEESASV